MIRAQRERNRLGNARHPVQPDGRQNSPPDAFRLLPLAPVVVYVTPLKEMAMYYDHTISQKIDHRRSTNDRSDVGSMSNDVDEVSDPGSARNWAWAHHSDLYDWMDWHSPFPASGQSE